jgi:hypothetical protein
LDTEGEKGAERAITAVLLTELAVPATRTHVL